jgi:OmpA-OmpF porin, OOP family
MAANLIAQLQNEFSDEVIGRLASYLGETPARTQRAVGYAIPAVVGGLFQKAQASGGAQDLLGTLQRGGFDGASIGDMASLARSATRSSDLVRSGGTVVSSVFGGRQDTLTDSIATASGLGKQSSSSLLALTASYVASLVSKEATAAGGLNATSIADLLGAQGPHLAGVAPSSLSQWLGVSSWERVDDPARAYERVPSTPGRAFGQEEKRGASSWLKWGLPLLLMAANFMTPRA